MTQISSDDSDSDDSDDDSENESENDGVEGNVVSDEPDVIPAPFDYNGHVERIKRLRAKKDHVRLQSAREAMLSNFPLSPQLWLDWIADERKKTSSFTQEGRAAIVDLFDKAVQDYLSVDVWMEYVHFTIEYMTEPEGSIEKVRTVFERALMAAGLHVPKGILLWESYREFEMIILRAMIPNSEGESAELSEQLKRVANLFKRQLSVPLLNMEKTFTEFEEWLREHTEKWKSASGKLESALVEKSNVELAYRKALDRLHQIQPYEDVLASCEESMKVNHYKEYLKFEHSLEDPVRLLCLFERALTDCPLDAPLWLQYVEFSDGMGSGDKTLQLCQRSVRNCPWFSLLWRQYLRCMEKCSKPHEEMKGILEEALKSGMQTAEDYRNMWLEYCSYFCRRIDWGTKEEGPLLLELRETVRSACEHLEQYFGNDGDPACQLLRFLATVDAVHSRKMEEARKTWNDILYKGHKSSAASWLQYIHLEMAYGDSKHLRKLFPRALQSTRDWPESIAEEWLSFERVEGSLESYEEAIFKCRSRIQQITVEREKAAAEDTSNQQSTSSSKQARSGKGERNQTKGKKVKSEPPTAERRMSSLKRPVAQEEKSAQSTADNDSAKRAKLDTARDHGTVTAHDPSKDNCTIFVSNLDYSTDDDKIREVFASVGTICELRLVRDFKGRSKGFCYVVFSSFEERNEALKKDREPIDGRPIFVSKCDPDKDTRQHGFKYSTVIEKNKLFVKGLPLSTTKDDLEKLFGQYGSIKDIRPVTYRNGHFKGLAYVDFEDEAAAAHALIKVDGMTIGDKVVSVAISNPPDRRTSLISDNKEHSSSFVQSLGGGAKEVGARGRGRTQVAFLPRALQVKQEDSTGQSHSNGAAKPKSNADFRQMLLAKK